MTDLTELIERVRNATGPDREIDIAIECAVPNASLGQHSYRPSNARGKVTCNYPNGRSSTYTPPRYTASLDAITRRIKRRLPGLVIKATKLGDGSGHWQITEAWMDDAELVDDMNPLDPRPGALAFTEVFLLAIQSQENSRDQ